MNKETGKVFLVGAGCGGADMITLRGLERLRVSDVVVYDDLTDTELLYAAPAHAERIYVGKRSGSHSAAQEEINALLTEKAREGKAVCRLKGGDPFVFGRGGEEMLALRAAGVPYEEIPGVTSAVAVPAAAGIPVTHRKLSRGFHVITAHTADTADGLPEGLDRLAALDGTLVFLMGLSQLGKLASRLMLAGMAGDTPAAVVSGKNAPPFHAVRGTLGDIAEKADGLQSPAVIVVGAAAAMDLSPAARLPLDGVTVGITGTPSFSGRLKAALDELGAVTVRLGRSAVRALDTGLELGEVFDSSPKWLVFTSGNGVERFFELLRQQAVDLRRLSACRFAVIGAATARALSEHGFTADLCPERYTSEALADRLLETVRPDEPVWLFRSAQGSPILYEKLRKRLTVRDVHTYTTVSEPVYPAPPGRDAPSPDYICFSSAGGVREFFDGGSAVPARSKCVCIGSVTADALRERYSGPLILSEEISSGGMVSAILRDLRGEE